MALALPCGGPMWASAPGLSRGPRRAWSVGALGLRCGLGGPGLAPGIPGCALAIRK